MRNESEFLKSLAEIRVRHFPKHQLSTFGSTALDYVIVSALPDAGESRLRRGIVTAEKPKIVTPETWQKRFEGFGDDEAAFGKTMERFYGADLRALEYVFKNDLKETTIEHAVPQELVGRVRDAMIKEDQPRQALLEAPDRIWSLAIMKFIVDMSLRSFPTHVQELDERGLFDPSGRERTRQKREIELLFRDAKGNAAARQRLGETLKAWGLFSEYEDRFFSLFSPPS